MSESARGTTSDMREANSLWAMDQLEGARRRLYVENEQLRAELAEVQLLNTTLRTDNAMAIADANHYRAELAAAKAQLAAVPWQEIFILCDIAESDGAKAAPTVVRAWLEAKAVQP